MTSPIGKRSHDIFVQQQGPAPSLQVSLRNIGWLGQDNEANEFYRYLKAFVDVLRPYYPQHVVYKGPDLDYFATAHRVRSLSLAERNQLMRNGYRFNEFGRRINFSFLGAILHEKFELYEVITFIMGNALSFLVRDIMCVDDEFLQRLDRYEFKLFDNLQIGNMHTLVKIGRLAEVQKLIEGGANTDSRDEHGNTILHLATAKGLKEFQAVLISHGANPYAVNKAGLRALEEDYEKHVAKLRELGWLGKSRNCTAFLVYLNELLTILFEKNTLPQKFCVKNSQQSMDLFETVKRIQNSRPGEIVYRDLQPCVLSYLFRPREVSSEVPLCYEALLFLFGAKWPLFHSERMMCISSCDYIQLIVRYGSPVTIQDIHFVMRRELFIHAAFLLSVSQIDLTGLSCGLKWIMLALEKDQDDIVFDLLNRKDIDLSQRFKYPFRGDQGAWRRKTTLLMHAFYLHRLTGFLFEKCDVNQVVKGTCLLNEAAKVEYFNKQVFEMILEAADDIDVNLVIDDEPLVFKCVRAVSGYSQDAVIPLLERGARHIYRNLQGTVLNLYELMPANLKDKIHRELHRVD